MTVHREPFLHLAGLTHREALIAWGAFFFRDDDGDGRGWGIVEDPDLHLVAHERRASIGVESRPFGRAEVEVVALSSGEVAARASTSERNHVWIGGLDPDTEYAYHVTVDGRPWVEGPCRAWLDGDRGPDLVATGRSYDTRFRTHPAPDVPAPLRFAVLGDYGVGILASGGNGARQRRVATALEHAVDHAGVRLVLTTGDNVYLGEDDTVAGTGRHDDDWYFSFYEPYRHVISRVPVYPGVGNHDSAESEVSDNRDQLADNMFTDLRFTGGTEAERASVDPGLFYRFSFGSQVHFVAIDTTEAHDLGEDYFVDHPRHRAFLEESLAAGKQGWVVPFSHHPPFCAGPKHGNAEHLTNGVVPLLERGGVRVMFSGHEHNFQHNRVGSTDYIVTGAAGKLRPEPPARFDQAGTRSWAAEGHFLVVDVSAAEMLVHPVTDVDASGRLTYVRRVRPDGDEVTGPIVLRR